MDVRWYNYLLEWEITDKKEEAGMIDVVMDKVGDSHINLIFRLTVIYMVSYRNVCD